MRRARNQLAGHRRWQPRRAGAADLWLPPLGAVRALPDAGFVGDRHRRRRGARLFRRLDRFAVSAVYRNLDLDPVALSFADHLIGAGAGLLRAARHIAAVFLGVAGPSGARGVPARPEFRIYPGWIYSKLRPRRNSARTRWTSDTQENSSNMPSSTKKPGTSTDEMISKR